MRRTHRGVERADLIGTAEQLVVHLGEALGVQAGLKLINYHSRQVEQVVALLLRKWLSWLGVNDAKGAHLLGGLVFVSGDEERRASIVPGRRAARIRTE